MFCEKFLLSVIFDFWISSIKLVFLEILTYKAQFFFFFVNSEQQCFTKINAMCFCAFPNKSVFPNFLTKEKREKAATSCDESVILEHDKNNWSNSFFWTWWRSIFVVVMSNDWQSEKTGVSRLRKTLWSSQWLWWNMTCGQNCVPLLSRNIFTSSV